LALPSSRIVARRSSSRATCRPRRIGQASRQGNDRLDQIICWLTGFDQTGLAAQPAGQSDFETFFAKATRLKPDRAPIKGVVCGIRVEDITEPLRRKVRHLDKLVDKIANGKAIEEILRQP
jgi:hypothetical protein